ncbi:hypothetical protein Lmor_0860 [Legionella moravica]|uniref:Uncharacterized protein n=1 Tax=Legionella moravica TaxID=39962 RepID=A0A378JX63_9GAMM|nr:hypothetical protein [Legionella moravica]KTD35413.1 hypothetical protein Lmor_0860 [Legionella moravica]STX61998.1 Uncharacterised protein [Legionella moravica]
MRVCCLLIAFIFNIKLYAGYTKPCEVVGFDKLVGYITLSDGHMAASLSYEQQEYELIELFKKCTHTAAVCMVDIDWERRKGTTNWISEQLIPPVDGDFDTSKRELIFALLQYIDKKSGAGVCIVAKNNFAQVLPWYGRSWVVTDQDIKDYEIYGSQFHISMTPNSLYEALLDVHNEAVWMAEHMKKPA